MTVKGKCTQTTVAIECDYKTCSRSENVVISEELEKSSEAIQDQLHDAGWEATGTYPCQSHICPEHGEQVLREQMNPENAKEIIVNGNFQSSIRRELRDNEALRQGTFLRVIDQAEEGVSQLREMFGEDADPAAHIHTVRKKRPYLGNVLGIFQSGVVGRSEFHTVPLALDDIIEAYLG